MIFLGIEFGLKWLRQFLGPQQIRYTYEIEKCTNTVTLSDNYFSQEIQLEETVKWFPSHETQCPRLEEINEWKVNLEETKEDCSFVSSDLLETFYQVKVQTSTNAPLIAKQLSF